MVFALNPTHSEYNEKDEIFCLYFWFSVFHFAITTMHTQISQVKFGNLYHEHDDTMLWNKIQLSLSMHSTMCLLCTCMCNLHHSLSIHARHIVTFLAIWI